MPISIVAGNWKMNTRVPEAFALATDIRDQLSNINEIEVVVCPPFISLNTVSEVLKYSSIQIGAQNTHNESSFFFFITTPHEVDDSLILGMILSFFDE